MHCILNNNDYNIIISQYPSGCLIISILLDNDISGVIEYVNSCRIGSSVQDLLVLVNKQSELEKEMVMWIISLVLVFSIEDINYHFNMLRGRCSGEGQRVGVGGWGCLYDHWVYVLGVVDLLFRQFVVQQVVFVIGCGV